MPILEWLNKGEAVKITKKLPYRMLKANAELSYGEQNENMIIQGDNLEALQALLPYYKGQVKCIFIDPPYNTKKAFDSYDDNLEHSIWLSLIYPRIELLRELLSEDGVIFVTLDESEVAYFKIICDEIFGRSNYLGDFIWQKRKGGGNDSYFFAIDHDYVISYTKNKNKSLHPKKWRVSQSEEYRKRYKEIDENGKRYYWDTVARNGLQNPIPVDISCPDGSVLSINSQESEASILQGLQNGNVRLTKGKNGWSLHHRVYMKEGQVLRSILTDVGTNKTAGDEMEALFGDSKAFDYPKPELLVSRLLELCTKKGDLVLDSFLGSGTTCAVAHKMELKYIGIEMGKQAITLCAPRMKAVIDGEQGGISKAINWQGGGGYTFYDLGETIFDENGNINKDVDFRTLASHVWFTETKTPLSNFEKSPLLGIHNGVAYYLLFNGILGDKKPDGGNVLTQKVLDTLPAFEGKRVIYGEATRMNAEKLKANNIVFKQTPYDIKAR